MFRDAEDNCMTELHNLYILPAALELTKSWRGDGRSLRSRPAYGNFSPKCSRGEITWETMRRAASQKTVIWIQTTLLHSESEAVPLPPCKRKGGNIA
jgi:hypothetical protein